MCLCISVCVQCFKYMDIFSLDGDVHFLSWLYTSSVLSIQNINLNDVLFIVLAVVAVVYCYLRSAIRIFIATSLLCMWRMGVCARASVCVQFYFKRIYVCFLDDEVHFLSWLYTSSVLIIQNIDLNDVLFLSSFQFDQR